MLYIICQNSHKYNDAIKVMMEKLGEHNYDILDPRIHDFKRTFSYVVQLGDMPNNITFICNKKWATMLPDSSLPVEDKKVIFAVLKEAVEYARQHSLRKEILAGDLPRFADLKQFLESFKGQVMELKLQDGRIIGIYPDEDKLPMVYSSEYHVSTILNLAKLQDVFNYTKLSVKDL